MKIKCYSVCFESLISITDKAYKVTCFDGTEAIIPKSRFFGQDTEKQRAEYYWVSAYILEDRKLQYSDKKVAWFESETKEMLPTYTVEHHTPEKIQPIENNIINELKK
ncbi:MAG: hypothetical protein LBN27_02090 [Prevotellaceae bacterium]|jgi:hypothetical protein|nr:hypothetical protein [Prevotellaceae bacterium]